MINPIGNGARKGGARGFTMMEIVIAVAMMAIVAAVTLPAIVRYLDQQEIDTSASTLSDMSASIFAFRTAIGGFPSKLTQLTTKITTADFSSCGLVYPNASTTKWGQTSSTGPFYPKALSATGLPLPIGIVSNTLTRTVVSSTPGFLQMTIPNVRFQDAILLNDQIDGTLDANASSRANSTGAIQWAPPISSTDLVTLTYNLALNKGC